MAPSDSMLQCRVKRGRRTAQQVAVAEGPAEADGVLQARRAARLEELGFADLGGYLQRRYVEQGWPVKQMRAELGVAATGWLRRWHGSASGDTCQPNLAGLPGAVPGARLRRLRHP